MPREAVGSVDLRARLDVEGRQNDPAPTRNIAYVWTSNHIFPTEVNSTTGKIILDAFTRTYKRSLAPYPRARARVCGGGGGGGMR
jgi:hypothetical protein